MPSIGLLSTYPPTPCGLANFSAALVDGLSANGSQVNVVRVADGAPSCSARVVGELINGSPASVARCADLLNRSDVAIIQHEFGIYGGADGDEVIDILGMLVIPSIVVLHTVPREPTSHQRSVLESVMRMAGDVVVMSEAAGALLRTQFGAEHRVSMIPHGSTAPTEAPGKRAGRPTLLTWGLLGPGKGVERVIDSMKSLQDLPGNPRYLIAGRTHPKVLAAEGEAYRDARTEQAKRVGVARSVSFDATYRSTASLSALAQASALVVLPYDSTEQVTSGVLVDAIASGRPVVATAFPHAVELLGSGAGLVVPHDDQEAMTSALRSVLNEPRMAGAMAAEARRMAPAMAWPVIARSYQAVAQLLMAKQAGLSWRR
ncbi:glycosyltransferase [Mycobacterium sp. AMU20-3851]|uniref:glycosyltransferase n=1 Tax=Mycobacterium sp. AMU20-3851 TaxID=3122055 RepID=UPI003754A1D3